MRAEYDAIIAFENHTKNGTWEEVKKKFLDIDAETRENVRKSAETLEALVQYRDIIDFKLYREAVETLFSPMHYNLTAQVNGDLTTNSKSHPQFKSAWYEFKVTPRAELRSSAEEAPVCIIKINAPGSRTLTSDIDTSIGASFKGDIQKLLEDAPNLKGKGPSYRERVISHIINEFYLSSERQFGITSGLHRDSNAYAEILDEEYPKFKNNDEGYNPNIGQNPLFTDRDFAKYFNPLKLKKHSLEMAASLFSLRVALEAKNPNAWETSKMQIKNQISESAENFIHDNADEKSFITAVTKDLENIFSETEKLFSKYTNELEQKKQVIEGSDYYKNSKLKDAEKAKDVEVSALNHLYVQYLGKMADKSDEIKKLQEEVNKAKIECKSLFENLKNQEKKIQKIENEPAFADEIQERKESCARTRKKFEGCCNYLKDHLLKIATLEIEKLELRYQAHTFANEAYVCRSAVYHVVNGMQQGGDSTLSQQTVLGSLLQQVGFKILHSHELEKQNKAPSEIAFRTSKYGQRIKDLLFKRAEDFSHEEIEKTFKKHGPSKLEILSRLKDSQYKGSLFKLYSAQELALLKTEAEIVSKIKKDDTLTETQKHDKTNQLIKDSNIEPKPGLFLSIASKTFAGVCLSKWDSKGALWGQETAKAPAAQEKKPLSLSKDEKIYSSSSSTPPTANKGAVQRIQGSTFKSTLKAENTDETGQSSHMIVDNVTAEQAAVLTNTNKNSFSKGLG